MWYNPNMSTDRDFNWLIEHGPELFRKYAGKWIAVYDGEVVGLGDTASAASDQAREKTGSDNFILEAVDAEADVIYGCT